MAKQNNKAVGKIGEDLAADLLKKKGYEILERNWGSKWGEIDIISKFKSTNDKCQIFVFTEVKTKVGDEFGAPEEMVNKKKLRQVQRIAETYARDGPLQARIDVVAVVLNEDLSVKRINHYEAVY